MATMVMGDGEGDEYRHSPFANQTSKRGVKGVMMELQLIEFLSFSL